MEAAAAEEGSGSVLNKCSTTSLLHCRCRGLAGSSFGNFYQSLEFIFTRGKRLFKKLKTKNQLLCLLLCFVRPEVLLQSYPSFPYTALSIYPCLISLSFVARLPLLFFDRFVDVFQSLFLRGHAFKDPTIIYAASN